MSKVLVFAISFFLILILTIIFPVLPPGDAIYNLFGISLITWSIMGLSGLHLVFGLINGLFWGLLILVFFIVISHTSKDTLGPMPTPSYIPEPTLPKIRDSSSEKKSPPKIIKRKTYVPLDQDIETIEGIGPAYGSKFRNIEIKVIEDLLRAGSTKKRRRELSVELGVAPKTILKWVYRADFFRLRGIGKQYSSLLESAGVNTVTDLSRRNPKNLYLILKKTNEEKNMVKRIPPVSLIQDWVACAKNLKTIILS